METLRRLSPSDTAPVCSPSALLLALRPGTHMLARLLVLADDIGCRGLLVHVSPPTPAHFKCTSSLSSSPARPTTCTAWSSRTTSVDPPNPRPPTGSGHRLVTDDAGPARMSQDG